MRGANSTLQRENTSTLISAAEQKAAAAENNKKKNETREKIVYHKSEFTFNYTLS